MRNGDGVYIQHSTLGKGMIHVLGGAEQDSVTFYHATQNSVQFKTHEFFIFGVFHVIFSYSSGLCVIETVGSKTTDNGELLYAALQIRNINIVANTS